MCEIITRQRMKREISASSLCHFGCGLLPMHLEQCTKQVEYACESPSPAADELANVPQSTKDIMQHNFIMTAGDCQLKGFDGFVNLDGAHINLPRDNLFFQSVWDTNEQKQIRSTCFASELQFHIGISSANIRISSLKRHVLTQFYCNRLMCMQISSLRWTQTQLKINDDLEFIISTQR